MSIFEAINKVMAQIGAVGKNDKNAQQGFMYRGIDAVMNAINPALVANGVFVVPEVLEQTREERTTSKGALLIYSICKIKFTFYAEDGSHVEAITIGEGMDSGDKATNKAMSIAFKYACFQVFCIPTEEMVDPDAECHEVSPKTAQKPANVDAKPKAQKPNNDGFITPEQKAQILHEINRTKVDIKEVCGRYKIETIDDLPAAAFEKLYGMLKKMEDR